MYVDKILWNSLAIGMHTYKFEHRRRIPMRGVEQVSARCAEITSGSGIQS